MMRHNWIHHSQPIGTIFRGHKITWTALRGRGSSMESSCPMVELDCVCTRTTLTIGSSEPAALTLWYLTTLIYSYSLHYVVIYINITIFGSSTMGSNARLIHYKNNENNKHEQKNTQSLITPKAIFHIIGVFDFYFDTCMYIEIWECICYTVWDVQY